MGAERDPTVQYSEQSNASMTHIRLQTAQRMTAAEGTLVPEISFEQAGPATSAAAPEQLGDTPDIRPDLGYNVDASVLSPFSTLA